jgi:spermidine synthase
MLTLRLHLLAGLSGAILMALEILASRFLAPHFGNSVYVWGSLISVFLGALSIGYSWGGRVADRHPRVLVLGRILLFASLWMLGLKLWGAPLTRVLAEFTAGSPAGTLLAATLLFGAPSVALGTVSPFVVRIAAHDLARLGDTAGRLYAISTLGSLAGTLLCTFVLIPRWSVSAIIAGLTAATALVALVGLGRSRLDFGAAALLVVAPFLVTTPGTATSGVLAVRGTAYQTIEVYEQAEIRFLKSDGITQSAISIDGKPFSRYIHYTPAALLVHPGIRSMLAIGMGGGLVSKTMRRALPELTIDYVEIDPAVPEMAERFGFWQPNEGDEVHIRDGRIFVEQTTERWDFVYVDAYIGLAVPFQLTTREFFASVSRRLEPGGVVGINLAAGLNDPFSASVLHTLRRSFPTTLVFRVRGAGNVLLLATGRPRPSVAEIEKLARSLASLDLEIPLTEIASDRIDWSYDASTVVELRDDFAPVEHLVLLGDREFDLALIDAD